MSNPPKHYTKTAVLLHWVIAAAIIFQLALGWRMVDEPKGSGVYALFQLHKSIGFTILALVCVRIGWRFTHQPPSLPDTMPVWEQWAAKLAHLGFYGIMLGLPLTGWILVSASSTNIPTVLFGTVPIPHLPFIANLTVDNKKVIHDLAELSHSLIAVLTLALLAAHIGAVLKHQLWVKDAVFSHMALGANKGWREPKLWLVLALVPTVFSAAWWIPIQKPRTQASVVTAITAPVNSSPQAEPETAIPSVESIVPIEPAATPVQERSTDLTEQTQTVAKPTVWQLNRQASQLGFVSSWSGAEIVGTFTDWQAEIVFDEQALEQARIKVTVNLAKVATGDEERDNALPSADWFDAAHYPQAVFVSKRVKKMANQRYQAQGQLTLRNQTKPVTLDFSLKINGKKAYAEGIAQLDRTDFGVGQGEWAATDSIPAAVKVQFKLEASTR
ncbi:YceI family protein [Agitococcus lubricus]|uniref:Cytochrome b561 n=1 Tax=Agitococcus lubricus TaxID=1077255 RepID=A0A2T5J325_9GAMM|nr:YceI family protein [Agitococcus lubricus]PTQ90938.1 cytochrome b561 [Agitococcus lubricus]